VRESDDTANRNGLGPQEDGRGDAMPATPTTALAIGSARRQIEGRGAGSAAICAGCTPDIATLAIEVMDMCSSSCNMPSATSRSLRLGSFSRQRRSRRRTGSGTSAGNALQSGSIFKTAAITSEMSSPSKARRRVSIS